MLPCVSMIIVVPPDDTALILVRQACATTFLLNYIETLLGSSAFMSVARFCLWENRLERIRLLVPT